MPIDKLTFVLATTNANVMYKLNCNRNIDLGNVKQKSAIFDLGIKLYALL